MNDRYLFRGKRIDNGEWVIGYYHQAKYFKSDDDLIDFITIPHPDIKNADNDIFIVIPETVGQCTGRKYGDGKLLFEGDIVECYSDCDDIWGDSHTVIIRTVVVWDDKNYCWGFKVDDKIASFNEFNEWDWDISMVLGNIHDNPELLEVK